jgi:hypothetical protein
MVCFGLLDATAAVYASAHDASAPNWEFSVLTFFVFLEFFFCFECSFATGVFLFLHLLSLKLLLLLCG